MAFDQATLVTGYAIFDGGSPVGHGIIDYRKDEGTVDEHIVGMLLNIQRLIRELSPAAVVIEDVVLQRSVKTLKDLSRLQGGIVGICQAYNIPCSILYPAEWRKLLGFKQGRDVKRPQLKQQAKDYVLNTYSIDATEDECDAICIGAAYISRQDKTNECTF